MTYFNGSNMTWAQNVKRLAEAMSKWGVGFSDYQVTCSLPNPVVQANTQFGWAKVEYRHPKTKQVVTMMLDTQVTASKNLNSIVATIEELRMHEVRGLAHLVAAHHYAALPAPTTERDPYEVMGLRPDADMAVVEAVFKSLAKSRHPDAGGSEAAMVELNKAIERIRVERKATVAA